MIATPESGPPSVPRVTADDLRQEAMTLRAMGWSIIPLTDRKTARVKWKHYQRRRPSDRELDRMFRLDGVGGLTVVAGRVSGGDGCSLVIRDFDTQAGYERWRTRNHRLAADAPTVRTRRGRHVYVRCPGFVPWVKLSDGELIADGGHVAVLPPSRHPSGTTYRWEPYPPLGISDFPIVALSDAGFGSAQNRNPHHREEDQRNRRREDRITCVPHGTPEITNLTVREAILRTLPRGPGERNDRLKYLARTLLDIYPPTARASDLYPVVSEWFRRAEPVVATKDFGTTWSEFRALWAKAAVPVSQSRPIVAMKGAAGSAPNPLEAACLALAGESPTGVFHLSGRTAARVTGIPHRTAARQLRGLVASGFLELVIQGSRGATTRRAAVYRIAGDGE